MKAFLQFSLDPGHILSYHNLYPYRTVPSEVPLALPLTSPIASQTVCLPLTVLVSL